MAKDINIKIGATDTASAIFGKVAGSVKRLGVGLDKVGSSMQSMGSIATGAGQRLATAGGLVTGAFAVATKTFAGFDDAMAAVSAKSGATGESLMRLREMAKELGSTTKFSASEAASGMEFLAQAGFKTEQILSAIGPALSLAAAGGVELNEAADIASNVAAGFGLSADEFGRVADVMARAATSANTDILMMGETFNQSAAIAKTAGQSIEETAAALGILANSGIQASSAGTDLKNVLSRLSVGKVQKKMKDLGVTIKDSNGEFRPMLDIMRDFGKQTESMTGPEKLALSMQLFGKYSGKSALILSDAADEVDNMRAKMVDANVTAKTMAETMQTGLGGLGTRLMSSLEGVQIAIGESIEAPLRVAGEAIAGFLGDTTEWIHENRDFVAAAAASAVAITGIGIALVGIGAATVLAGASISALGTVAGVAGAAMTAALTPVGLVVAPLAIAVAGLGVAFGVVAYKTGLMKSAVQHATSVLRKLLDVAKITGSGIADALSSGDWELATRIGMAGVKVAFWEGLREVHNAFLQMLPKIWITIRDFLLGWAKATAKTAMFVTQAIQSPSTAFVKPLTAGMLGSGQPDNSSGRSFADNQIVQSRIELANLLAEAKRGNAESTEKTTPINRGSQSMVDLVASTQRQWQQSKVQTEKQSEANGYLVEMLRKMDDDDTLRVEIVN
jgi:TP901 family phage tail tape measure protein